MNWASWVLVALFTISFISLLGELNRKKPIEVAAWFVGVIAQVVLIYFSGGWQ